MQSSGLDDAVNEIQTPWLPLKRFSPQPTLLQCRSVLVNMQWHEVAVALGFFVVALCLLATIQFATPNLVGTDGYFHIRFAQVMRVQGIRPDFPWLPLTVLHPEAYADHHLLYHIFLMPFTYGDLRVGAKWAAILFPALAFVAGYRLLRDLRVPHAALWAVGFLAMSQPFLYRLNMTRVQGASLLLLISIVHVTLTGRHRWLGPLMFIYVWLYDGFIFGAVAVSLYVLMRGLLDHHVAWKPLGYVALGIAMGHLINPYFPNNVYFTVEHILTKVMAPLANNGPINVGNEWKPYTTWNLVEHSLPSLLVFLAGCFALGLQKERMTVATATLFGLTIFFGLTLFQSRRFIEYYPAFALLFCALAWQPLWQKTQQTTGWSTKFLPLLLLMLFVPAIWFNLQQTRQIVQRSTPHERFADAAAWLRDNTVPGSRIFQTDWDLFPQLFYYNIENTYVAGLDPTYQQHYRADLYATWRQITRGEVELPGLLISTMFGAEYVISDLDHQAFLARAAADPHLHEVFRDTYAAIFQVR